MDSRIWQQPRVSVGLKVTTASVIQSTVRKCKANPSGPFSIYPHQRLFKSGRVFGGINKMSLFYWF